MTIQISLAEMAAFATAARELNLRRAAELLHISQPPLSRKIKKLEEKLGVCLFLRHNHGLELTQAGREAFKIIMATLKNYEEAQIKLENLTKNSGCALGLTTAFEQEIYEAVLKTLQDKYNMVCSIKRASSIQLAADVARGNLTAAFVALPMSMPGLSFIDLHYEEKLLALVPENWNIAQDSINLADLNNKPFFWFSSRRNPFWHEFMQGVFKQTGFKPLILEEPLEHDVLLARVASGEAFGLLPESFASIQRKGAKFLDVRDAPPIGMAIIFQTEDGKKLGQKCAKVWNAHHRVEN